ncbi:MAG: hypothetical protein WBQ03_12435 [Candidatus Sulfotelmatobacter sp.]
MPEKKQITRAAQYARCADFRRIFDEDMNSLYLLSFLLTADRVKAEGCFVSGLEDAIEGNPVFKEWARSWARRVIIQNAVRVINPRPAEERNSFTHAPASSNGDTPGAEQHEEFREVLRLEPFERFVSVMTVLEHYSDHDCSLLLGCARRDVLEARVRALQRIGSAAELRDRQLPTSTPESPRLRERSSSVLELLVAPHFATSA